ncbi:hypothetical protein HDU67_006432 [Dinochytrium kinnereticum]|nr:hypothetical protein HDU67_006432 [Dinochytrium kinnereticum]
MTPSESQQSATPTPSQISSTGVLIAQEPRGEVQEGFLVAAGERGAVEGGGGGGNADVYAGYAAAAAYTAAQQQYYQQQGWHQYNPSQHFNGYYAYPSSPSQDSPESASRLYWETAGGDGMPNGYTAEAAALYRRAQMEEMQMRGGSGVVQRG